MSRFAQVLIERLQGTRLRLLDVYGNGDRQLSPPRPGAMTPRPFRVAGARARHRRHLDARARAASRATARRSRRASSRCSTRSGSARCRSRSAAPPNRPGPVVHTVRAVGAVTQRDLRLASRARCSACAGRSATSWPVDAARGRRRRRRRRRDRPRAAPPGRSCARSPAARDYGAVGAALRRAHAGRPPLPRRARASGATPVEVEVTVDTAGARLARPRRRRRRS